MVVVLGFLLASQYVIDAAALFDRPASTRKAIPIIQPQHPIVPQHTPYFPEYPHHPVYVFFGRFFQPKLRELT